MPSKKQGVSLEIVLTPDSTQNVVLIRGTPDTAPLTRLTGKIIVQSPEPFAAKKISLKLLGTMRLKWDEVINVGRNQQVNHPLRYEKTVFEKEIDLSEIVSSTGSRASSNPASGLSTPLTGSHTNLAGYFANHHGSGHGSGSNTKGTSTPTSPIGTPHNYLSRTGSSMGLHLGSSKKDMIIAAGTQYVPFEMVIHGNIPESIEGNDNAHIVYWLVATIERGRFTHNVVSRRHIRIMRTLSVDTYDAAQSISIENVWPKKVEYTMEVPSKAIPIGATTEVLFTLQPLQKGLSLGKVKLSLLQSLVMHLPTTQSTTIDTHIYDQVFDTPRVESEDQWCFFLNVQIPTSLSKVTPDCLIQPNVKVSHKLKVVVALKNADGHTSELRASLPVTLFISPRIPVVASDAGVIGADIPPQESLVFSAHESQSQDDDSGAPPNYRNHVFDRLFSEVSTPMTPSSPIHSGTTTPARRAGDSLNSLNALQHDQLSARLRALQLSRESEAISAQASTVDVVTLSRVPSYDHAMTSAADHDQAPDYH